MAQDAEAIAEFVWRVVEANPGVGVENDAFRRHWQDAAKSVLGYPIDRYLCSSNPRAFIELKAALLIVLIHDNFGGFIMASDAPRYIATVMLPHAFESVDVEHLVNRANAFVRHMRKDTPFWEDFPLFRAEEVAPWQSSRSTEIEAFCRIIRSLPLGSRAHFFDVVSRADTRAASGAQPLEQATSFGTRKRGLDASESAHLLVRSGLFTRSEDMEGFLQRLTHNQLTEFLAAEGLHCKKSWKKDKLISLAMEQRAEAVREKAKGICVARLEPTFGPVVQWAHEEIERTIPFFQVWLAFAFVE